VKKYDVHIVGKLYFDTTVPAEDEDEAKKKAYELFYKEMEGSHIDDDELECIMEVENG
jgi:hypothetical protein